MNDSVTRKDLSDFYNQMQERLDLIKEQVIELKSPDLQKAYLKNYQKHGVKLWGFANEEEEHQATEELINFHKLRNLAKDEPIIMREDSETFADGDGYIIKELQFSRTPDVNIKVGFGTVSKGEPN